MRKPISLSCVCRFLAAGGAMLALFGVLPAASQESDLARSVKATYLFKFAPFVQWPESAFASPTSPLEICVVGDDAFGRLVSRAVAGERMELRAFVVRRFSVVDQISGCHILFADGGGRLIAEALEAVRGQPVLTVTDSTNNSTARGVIHFVVYNGRVRFEVDIRIARQQGVEISSRVLELAVRVHGERG